MGMDFWNGSQKPRPLGPSVSVPSSGTASRHSYWSGWNGYALKRLVLPLERAVDSEVVGLVNTWRKVTVIFQSHPNAAEQG
jgi:hypothetical protein